MITATKELAAKHQHFHDLVGDETVSYTMLDYISTTAVNTGVAYVMLLDKSTKALEDRIEAEKYQALLVHRNPLKRRIIPAQEQTQKEDKPMRDYLSHIAALEKRIENLDQIASNTQQEVTITSEDGCTTTVVRLDGTLGQALREESNLMQMQLNSANNALKTLQDLFLPKD